MMSAEFIESQRQFAIALEAARSIRARAWSVYRLDPYEEDGSQGTRFVFIHSKPTREEAFASASNDAPGFVVEEHLAADGTRWFLKESDDKRLWDKGTPLNKNNLMAAGLTQSAEGYVYDEMNDWVSARITRNGIENCCAEAISLEAKPKGWKRPQYYPKYWIHVVFADDDDTIDEKEEEDYDY